MKKIISVICILSLLAAGTINIMACGSQTEAISKSLNESSSSVEAPDVDKMGDSEMVDVDPSKPSPTKVADAFSVSLNGRISTSANVTFTSEYKYFQMYVKNTGSAAISVDIGNNVYRVAANSSKYIYSTSAWGAQTCTFYFGTANAGTAMKGSASCILTTTLAEAKP